MIKIRKDICIVLIAFLLITSGDFNYSQNRISKVAPDKPKYEYFSNDKESSVKSEADVYKTQRRNTKNYFKIDHSGMSLWNGKHWIPENFPLKVYVRKSESDNYKAVFGDYIEYGFKVWQQADPRIKYQLVNSPGKADIIILFEENLMDKYEENFLGLTDYELGPGRQIEVSTVEISLLKYNDEVLSEGEIKATIIHEIGHALGLGHSSNSADLMYPYIDPESSSEMSYDELSKGDTEAIRSVIDLCYYIKYTWN